MTSQPRFSRRRPIGSWAVLINRGGRRRRSRLGAARRAGAAAGRRLHGRPGPARAGGLRRALRVVPWRKPRRRGVRTAAVRDGLPSEVGRSIAGGALHAHDDGDAAGAARLARRRHLRGRARLHPPRKRRTRRHAPAARFVGGAQGARAAIVAARRRRRPGSRCDASRPRRRATTRCRRSRRSPRRC